ncbi:carbohydrate ABC transporter substrate-binding protein (CUT1 family) [Kribbella amoyensis]|uniref:Carbohydrate ABC transporter substrate-binding protein (CUT1 family) n=1 Tax=Kribbella amoyensis TaxID=996641 RepID=A0A561BS82_9ACTN|nr:hypothetical protein [Kribbella amoyensis]TWD81726.1 carbohydrate ABC transporter substrate-binding protein (CUT1 family) [Kribbella amoyensis]
MTGAYRGLTWDHPRGRDALVAASGTMPGATIDWDTHPLSGFESTPIADLASRYDVIVLDHPHLGEALAHDCLRPLDEVFDPGDLRRWATETAGPSFASYTLDGHVWALPLDAATQVAATRVDLAGEMPVLWSDVVALSQRVPVALSVAGPHALLTFASICVALGEEPGGSEGFVAAATGTRALELMTDLVARAPRYTVELDPIGLLEDMVHGDSVAHCPLVYGYVNYSATTLDRRVSFTDAPSSVPGGRVGSTLGGTGLAVTRRCEVTPELVEHLGWLLSRDAQEAFIPAHSGQPSLRSAWLADSVNDPVGGFYRDTLRSVTQAWVRPRYDGYIAFQTEAAEVVRSVVTGGSSIAAGSSELDTLYLNGIRPTEGSTR